MVVHSRRRSLACSEHGDLSLPLEFWEEIHSSRLTYLSLIGKISSLGEGAVEHFTSRVRCARNGFGLGEAAPMFLREVFHVSDSVIRRIRVPWLMLYHYALALDDLVDRDICSDRRSRRMLDSLFLGATEAWRTAGYRDGRLWREFRRYHREEVRSGVTNSVCLDTLGKRAALVKFLASALCFSASGRPLQAQEEAGLELVCSGFQLVDELADLEEDVSRGRRSMVMERATMLLSTSGTGDDRIGRLTPEGVRAVALLSGAAVELSQEASARLREGVGHLRAPEESVLAAFVQRLTQALDASTLRIRTLLLEEGTAVSRLRGRIGGALSGGGSKEFDGIARQAPERELLERVVKLKDTIPGASN